jgi:hypothetical protein
MARDFAVTATVRPIRPAPKPSELPHLDMTLSRPRNVLHVPGLAEAEAAAARANGERERWWAVLEAHHGIRRVRPRSRSLRLMRA